MDADRWNRVGDCFHSALEQAPHERAAFLARACANDPELLREVESLLDHEGQADRLLDSPAWNHVVPPDETNTFLPGRSGSGGGLAAGVLQAGSVIAEYRIEGKLGSGGMGEVYRATDTKLQREVALKVLTPSFARDSEWLSRFQREARVLASLNHPHIAAIYNLEESGGVRAIAMELVEGPTLADRLARGGIPIPEALAIAKQIAEALEYAHEKSVVHRDLKPANVKLRPDGVVKVLDFGLAKAAIADGSPTSTATGNGVILGTPAYMPPEQAVGMPVDRRADIWAFGVVLFEMLTGERLFKGKSTPDTLAGVLRGPIDLDQLPSATPQAIRRLLERCLDRDVRNRLRDIGEARVAIDRAIQSAGQPEAATAPARIRWLWPAVAGALFLVIIVGLVRHWRSGSPTGGPAVRLTMDLTPAENLVEGTFDRPELTAMVFSPDGNTLVFSGVRGGSEAPGSRTQLYRRTLEQAEAVPIPGTEGGSGPFFSPDGKWVGFWPGRTLKKVSMSGGPAVAICDASKPVAGATWGSADTIVFSDGTRLMQVPAAGGTPQVLVQPDPAKDEMFTSPEFLPDGKTLLFTVRTSYNWQEAQIVALRPGSGERRVLVKGGTDAHYVPTGHLVYLLNAVLMAVPFDASRLECTGTPVPLLDGVMQAVNMPNSQWESGLGQFAVSHSGHLVYALGGIFPASQTTLVRLDRKGAATDLGLPKGPYPGLRLSPDGQRLAVSRSSLASRLKDIWTWDLARGAAMRLTMQGVNSWPLWSFDGKRILFTGGPGGTQILSIPADGQGAVETVAMGKRILFPSSWSPDGKWLAYVDGENQIWIRPMAGPEEPKLFLESKSRLQDPEISPDGRWIAFTSTESGTNAVYVQAFPGPGEKHRISTENGSNPAWARSGRELFYLNERLLPGKSHPTVTMMAVEFAAGTFKAGLPRMLFDASDSGGSTAPLRTYDVYPDGQHFIMRRREPLPDQRVTRLNVVLNWFEELKRRVPRGAR